MKIASVQTYAVRIPRAQSQAVGTAGLPASLRASAHGVAAAAPAYQWAATYQTLYSAQFETLLVRIESDEGLTGWGEVQAPLAPEIPRQVIETLLAPVIIGQDALAPELLRERMYSAMRVRGHSGGFLLDSIAGIDLAIWDLLGKACDQPLWRLFGGSPADVRCYISGLAGSTPQDKLASAEAHFERGARSFKVFLDGSETECLSLIDNLRDRFDDEIEILVDALWRLTPKSALRFSRALESRAVGWLEAPLKPEDLAGHRAVTRQSRVPIAIGESYRTRFELLPFFEARALDILQPDLGRTGLTEGRKIASLAEAFHIAIAPHVSIGLGPQIAASLHLAAACTNLQVIECNPVVYGEANQFLKDRFIFTASHVSLPDGPGLGVSPNLDALRRYIV